MPESWETCKMCGHDPAVPAVVDSAPVPEGLAAMASEIEAAAAAAKRAPARKKSGDSSVNVLMYTAAIASVIVMIVIAGLVRNDQNDTVDASPTTATNQPAERAVPAEPTVPPTATTTPDAETSTRRVFVAAGLNALCAGTFDKVDTVAPYDGGPGEHPLTIVDQRGGATFELDGQPRYPLLATTIATAGNQIEKTELVLCLRDGDQRSETSMCAGAEVELTTNDLDLRLIAARSGDVLWESTVEAPTPIECPDGINPFGPTDVPMPVPARAIGDRIAELLARG
ncbi:MAG: hypothetical protein HKN26_05455 [Acidimicrobiales bacterium]|nr:hypothetical protein [Acidimicrobiales bacterium]